MEVMSFEIILCSGKRKLGISVEDVKIYLEDGTEIDETIDDKMRRCWLVKMDQCLCFGLVGRKGKCCQLVLPQVGNIQVSKGM